jgi:hypothetical protein
MKNIKLEENIPAEVLFIRYASVTKYPLGLSFVQDTITKYPEYFPEEVEYRRKWNLIPQSVHDEYWEKSEIIREECFKDLPPSLGILGWMENSGSFENWSRAYDIGRKKSLPLLKDLHNSLYKEYGIEFNGI